MIVRLGLMAVVVVGLGGACSPSWPAGLQLQPPVQEPLPASAPKSFVHKGHVVQPQAVYTVDALVLSKESYRADANADVSPIDLALGWGVMADSRVLEKLRVRQNDRYFFWSGSGPMPAPRDVIEASAANTHLIWGKKEVGKVIDDVDVGDVVHLRGALVNVTFKDGHEMKSSLAREDTGGGACEVMWVDEAKIVPQN